MPDAGLLFLEGVQETPTEYCFEPLALVVRKGQVDTTERLLASGMATSASHRWSAFASRPLILPNGMARAGLCAAVLVLRGTLPIVVGGLGTAVIGTLVGSSALIAVGVVGVMISVSLAVHEMGHAVALRAVDPNGCAILVSRRGSAALTRRALTRWRETLVVCAGPCAPAVIGVPLIALVAWSWLVPAAWLLISIAHLATLALPVGDGGNLRTAWRRRGVARLRQRRRRTGTPRVRASAPEPQRSPVARRRTPRRRETA